MEDAEGNNQLVAAQTRLAFGSRGGEASRAGYVVDVESNSAPELRRVAAGDLKSWPNANRGGRNPPTLKNFPTAARSPAPRSSARGKGRWPTPRRPRVGRSCKKTPNASPLRSTVIAT